MGIVVLGAVFVDIKGYPEAAFVPTGRNVGRVETIHGGVGRNVAEDVANCELRPTFISLVDESGAGIDVIRKLKSHKVNTNYIRATRDGMGTWLAATALTVAAALYVTVLLAKTVGGILPMAAKFFKADPAIMAAPLITTIVDAISLIVYFNIASVLLPI